MVYYDYNSLVISDWYYDFDDLELSEIMAQYDTRKIKTLEEGLFEKFHYMFNDEETMNMALTHLQVVGYTLEKSVVDIKNGSNTIQHC